MLHLETMESAGVREPLHGFFLIDKRSGPSSAQCINPIKRIPGVEKVGHAGTLDPLASGLLVVGINNATRLMSIVQGGTKRYSGTFVLGYETDTYDSKGQVTNRYDTSASVAMVIKAGESFVGTHSQQPPEYSAKKIQGVRAYELARSGKPVILAPRIITIEELKITQTEIQEYHFECTCSTGTYIRSLIFDIGRILGTGACLTSLRREGSFPFSVSDAVSIESLSAEHIIPWWTPISAAPRFVLNPQERQKLHCGNQNFIPEKTEKFLNNGGCPEFVLYTDEAQKPLGVFSYNSETSRYELMVTVVHS